MAKALNHAIPYRVRDLAFQIEEALMGASFGVPMNCSFSALGNGAQEVAGKAVIHWPGRHVVADVLTSVGHYGERLRLVSLKCTFEFGQFGKGRAQTEAWMRDLEAEFGPLEWPFGGRGYGGDGKLRFTLEGIALDRLKLNASNRRNGLPTYRWDAPDHPFLRRKSEG